MIARARAAGLLSSEAEARARVALQESSERFDVVVIDEASQSDVMALVALYLGNQVLVVGDDEQDASAGLIGWSAPMARALRGAGVGDLRKVALPGGEKEWEVVAIDYPEIN